MGNENFWDFEAKIFNEVAELTQKECKEDYKKIACVLNNWVGLLNIVKKYSQDEVINSVSAVFLLNSGKQMRWIAHEILSGTYFEAIRDLRWVFETIIWSFNIDNWLDEEAKLIFGVNKGSEMSLKYETLALKDIVEDILRYTSFKDREKIKKEKIEEHIKYLSQEQKELYRKFYSNVLNKLLFCKFSGKNGLIWNLPFVTNELNELYGELSKYTHFSHKILQPIYEKANWDLVFNFSLDKELVTICTNFLIKVMDVFYSSLYLKFIEIRDEIKQNIEYCKSHGVLFPITEGAIKTPIDFRVSFREAQELVNFKILSGNYIARDRGWGKSLYHREIEVESETHRKLKELSVRHFQKLGYRTNQIPVGIKEEHTISDYFMVKNGIFYFVECLTNEAIRSDPKIIERKLKLSEYAPMWFVLDKTANLKIFPEDENVHFLLIDIKRNKCIIPKKKKERSLVWQLGESDDPSAIPKLIEFTKSNNANERRLAASGLGKLAKYRPQIYKACPYLIKLLKDEKPQVRQYTVKALGKIKYVKALPHLRELLNDEKYYVREADKIAIRNCELEYERYKRARPRD